MEDRWQWRGRGGARRGLLEDALRRRRLDAVGYHTTWILDRRSADRGRRGFAFRPRRVSNERRALTLRNEPVRLDSQAKHALLAGGRGDLFTRLPRPGYVERVWDFAAAKCVVEEAGGAITDLKAAIDVGLGTCLDASVEGIVASGAPALHREALDAVNAGLAAAKDRATVRRSMAWRGVVSRYGARAGGRSRDAAARARHPRRRAAASPTSTL